MQVEKQTGREGEERGGGNQTPVHTRLSYDWVVYENEMGCARGVRVKRTGVDHGTRANKRGKKEYEKRYGDESCRAASISRGK